MSVIRIVVDDELLELLNKRRRQIDDPNHTLEETEIEVLDTPRIFLVLK
jgi:hypothetical protein